MAVVAIGTLSLTLVWPQNGYKLSPSAALGETAHPLGLLLWTGGLLGPAGVLDMVNRAGTLPPSTAGGDTSGWTATQKKATWNSRSVEGESEQPSSLSDR